MPDRAAGGYRLEALSVARCLTMAENGRRVGTPAGDVTSACYDKGIAQTDGGAAPRVTARFGSRKERELVEINLEVKGA